MFMWKEVFCHGECVGKMQVEKEGLYFKFSGKFKLEQNKIWRIIAASSKRKIDLGICIFEAPYFILHKKIPMKYFDDAEWTYTAVCPADQREENALDDGVCERLQDIEKGRLIKNCDASLIVIDSDH